MNIFSIETSNGTDRVFHAAPEPDRAPDVAAVGAWFSRAKELRETVRDYVPKHRAPGPAI